MCTFFILRAVTSCCCFANVSVILLYWNRFLFDTYKNKTRALIKVGGLNSKGMAGEEYKKAQAHWDKNIRKYR